MPEASPLISVIVPCYNYGLFLAEALDSVGKQTWANWECIVVDDGSTDDTARICKGFVDLDERFRYVYQQHEGVAAARNTGLKICQGDLVQFLDADDMLEPTKFERQLAVFSAHPEADIVYGDAHFFHTCKPGVFYPGRNGQASKTASLKCSGTGAEMVRRFCINNFVDTGAPLIRRRVVERVGAFVTSYKTYEDWHYWFRCALLQPRFVYDPSPGGNYLHRYGHTSAMTNTRQLVKDGIRIRRYMRRYLPFRLALYNEYRLAKLLIKKFLLVR